MLPIKNRLKHKADFEVIFAKGYKINGAGLGLRFGKRYKPDVPSRFGFVVGTKVSKEAVTRNRLRRQMRESVRLLIGRVPVGYDFAFIVFPEGRDLKFAEIKEWVERLLLKTGLMK